MPADPDLQVPQLLLRDPLPPRRLHLQRHLVQSPQLARTKARLLGQGPGHTQRITSTASCSALRTSSPPPEQHQAGSLGVGHPLMARLTSLGVVVGRTSPPPAEAATAGVADCAGVVAACPEGEDWAAFPLAPAVPPLPPRITRVRPRATGPLPPADAARGPPCGVG